MPASYVLESVPAGDSLSSELLSSRLLSSEFGNKFGFQSQPHYENCLELLLTSLKDLGVDLSSPATTGEMMGPRPG